MKYHIRIPFFFFLLIGLSDFQCVQAQTIGATLLNESFEGQIPDLHTFQATYKAVSTQSQGGAQSLLIQPSAGKTGGAYFKLGNLLLPGKSYRFSAAVYMAEGGKASLYLSASDGTVRKVLSTVSGGAIGQWVTLTGNLSNDVLKGNEQDVMLAMVPNGAAYYDEVTLVEIKPIETPITAWPKNLAATKALADRTPHVLPISRAITLKARHGVLSPDLSQEETIVPTVSSIEIPADGVLVFALDLPKAAEITGALQLKHGSNLHPGLRAYVMMNSILIGAPMVSAAPWSNPGRVINRPVPNIAGTTPSDSVVLTSCRLRAGRHYLVIMGPHGRSAGEFQELSLMAKPLNDSPLYSFALFSDTHIGEGRSEWMNTKLMGPVADQLAQAFRQLYDEAIDFAFIAGDMTDTGTARQYETLGRIAKEARFPVYGVMGNHETFQATSRADLIKHAIHLFPNGETYYTLSKPPVRFLVLDKSYWKNPEGSILDYPAQGYTANTITPPQVAWVEQQLASDRITPTVVLSHFPFFAEPRPSSSGYELVSWAIPDAATGMILNAPNVVATLNGHTHWNQVGQSGKVTWIQNAAFVEWPSTYRVFRVYPNRMEWETRIAPNLGFLRESIITKKGLSWMISTKNNDLAGQIKLP